MIKSLENPEIEKAIVQAGQEHFSRSDDSKACNNIRYPIQTMPNLPREGVMMNRETSEIHYEEEKNTQAQTDQEIFENDFPKKSMEEILKENEDMVNNPPHYKSHPSGVECITIVEHFPFNIGKAIQCLWDYKGASLEDLKKAEWYVKREIQKREREAQ